jgi:hypothetical protein
MIEDIPQLAREFGRVRVLLAFVVEIPNNL